MDKTKIKCYKCKKYFNSVIIFKENQDKDYQGEKWYCANCFNKECYNKGYQEAEQGFLKDEIEWLRRFFKQEISHTVPVWITEEMRIRLTKLEELKSTIKQETKE